MRLYLVRGTNMTVAGATTLAQILAPIGTQICPIRVAAGQKGVTSPAMQDIQVHQKLSVFSTVTSFTPQAVESNNTMASLCVGGTAATGTNASAEGAGTETVIWGDVFNILGSWLWIPTELEREAFSIGKSAAQAMSIKLPTAPATLTGWWIQALFGET